MTLLQYLLAPEVFVLASQGRMHRVCEANKKFLCLLTFIKILPIISLVKKLLASVSGLITYLSAPLVVLAQSPSPAVVDPCSSSASNDIAKTLCALGGENVGRTVRNVVVFFVILAVVIALLYLLYGGVKWITSKGDKAEVESARNHIIAAIIGLIVVFLAVFIVSIILTAFGLDFTKLIIPNISQ